MNTSNNMQYPLTTAAKCLLQGYDLSFLREDYEKEALSISFDDCKRHYVEYLLAEITAYSLLLVNNSLKVTPPLHVDKLWKLHVQETRDYRQFEKYVLFIYRQSGRATNLVHLDYSNKDSRNRRQERLEQTKSLYRIAGLVFVNTDEEQQTNDSSNDVQKIFIQERNQQVLANSNISVSNSTSNQSSSSSMAASEERKDQVTKSKRNEEERSKEVSLSSTSQQTLQTSSSTTTASEETHDKAIKHEQSEDQIVPTEKSDSQTDHMKLDLPDNLLAPSRNNSKSVGESNLEQDRPPEQMKEHPALSGQKRSYQEAIKSDLDEVRKLGKPDERKEGSTYEDVIVLDE